MQTLAKYFVALLLFIFTYFSEKHPPKEEVTNVTINEQQQPKELVCKTTAEIKNFC